MHFVRDYSMMVAIFGFFSMVWYGWSQENPPKNWRKVIGFLTGLALLVCLSGIYLSIKNWEAGTALAAGHSLNNYYVFVILEFVIAGVGVFILYRKGGMEYAAPWVCFIVGVHFFGLRYVFQDFSLHILGFILVLIASASLYLSKKLSLNKSTITGLAAGTTLLLFAGFNLFRFI